MRFHFGFCSCCCSLAFLSFLADRKSDGCRNPSADHTDTNVVIGIDGYLCDGINTLDLYLILYFYVNYCIIIVLL